MEKKEAPDFKFEFTVLDKNSNEIIDSVCRSKIMNAVEILNWNATIKSEMFLSIKANGMLFNIKHFCINSDTETIELTLKEVQ